MEIRKDFVSAATYLHRLSGIGDEFSRLNSGRWSHLKNQEDFEKVYAMELPRRIVFENMYGDGRDMAGYMADQLRKFNSVVDFPTLADYVKSFDKTWCAEVEELEQRIEEMKSHVVVGATPWAVREMIGIWEDQVKLLGTVVDTLELLKQTDIYRVEIGEIKLSDLNKQQFNIGVVGNVHGGRVNVGSTDNSANIDISADQVFTNIRDRLSTSNLAHLEKGNLLKCVDEMEANVGKPTFTKRYQDFIAVGANHMSLLSPFFPTLTSLLSG